MANIQDVLKDFDNTYNELLELKRARHQDLSMAYTSMATTLRFLVTIHSSVEDLQQIINGMKVSAKNETLEILKKSEV